MGRYYHCAAILHPLGRAVCIRPMFSPSLFVLLAFLILSCSRTVLRSQSVRFDPLVLIAACLIEQSVREFCIFFFPSFVFRAAVDRGCGHWNFEENAYCGGGSRQCACLFSDLEIARLVFEVFEVPCVVGVELVGAGAKQWSSFYWAVERKDRRISLRVRRGWCVAELPIEVSKRRHCNADLRYVIPNAVLSFVKAIRWRA
jgi:hypothetical protein